MKLVACVLVLAAACSDDAKAIVDAGLLDAPSRDGEVGEAVEVTVTNDSGPIAGLAVYFQNADSSLVATADTDATGRARAVMAAGGFVTVVTGPLALARGGQQPELVTWAGVAPGDHLRLGPTPQVASTFTLTYPAEPTTNVYELYAACRFSQHAVVTPQPTGTITADVYGARCDAPTPVIVVAHTAAGLRVVTAPAQVVGDGASVTVTGSYQPLVASAIVYDDIPADVTDVDGTQYIATVDGPLSYSRDDAPPSAGAVELDFAQPVAPAAGLIADSSTYFARNGWSVATIADRTPYAATSTIAVAPLMVRQFTSTAALDDDGAAVRWTEATTGAPPDLTRMRLVVTPSAASRWEWRIAAPYRAGTLALPRLPAALAAFVLEPRNVFVQDARLIATDAGADRGRAQIFISDDPLAWGDARVVFEQLATD